MSATARPSAVPNRPDARTIRAALKAAGVTIPVRITSGRNTTYVNRLDRESSLGWTWLTEAEALEVAAALRPLWNDGDKRVSLSTPFESDGERLSGGVTIARAGWHTTAPLEADLDVIAYHLPAGKVAELREESTREERVAELEDALGDELVVTQGAYRYRLAPGTGHKLGRLGSTRRPILLPGDGQLEAGTDAGGFARIDVVTVDRELTARHAHLRELLLALDRRRVERRQREAVVDVPLRTDVI